MLDEQSILWILTPLTPRTLTPRTPRILSTSCRRSDPTLQVRLLQPIEEVGMLPRAQVFTTVTANASTVTVPVEAPTQDNWDFIRKVSRWPPMLSSIEDAPGWFKELMEDLRLIDEDDYF